MLHVTNEGGWGLGLLPNLLSLSLSKFLDIKMLRIFEKCGWFEYREPRDDAYAMYSINRAKKKHQKKPTQQVHYVFI